MKNSFLNIFVGAERSGKSFYAKHLAGIYSKNRGSVLVYNIGKQEDFPDSEYYMIEPLEFADHIQLYYSGKEERRNYRLKPVIEYFKCKGKIYHLRDFSKLFYKRKVKMYKIQNRQEETAFFKSLYKYVSRTLLILDDCVTTFQYGLNDGHKQLFSRKNHSGVDNSVKALQAKGVDVVCIFHNIDHVNKDLWDFTTGLICFKFPFNPTYKKFNNPQLQNVVERVHLYLQGAPQYTAIEIPVQGEFAMSTKDVTLKL